MMFHIYLFISCLNVYDIYMFFVTEFPSFCSPATLMLMSFYRFKVGMASLVFELQITQHRGEVLGPKKSSQKIARLVADPELRSLLLWRLLGQHLEQKMAEFYTCNFFFKP